jgi:hypothetical protein
MSGATLKIEGVRFVITVDPERRIIRDVVTPGFCNARASSLRHDGPSCDGTYGLPLVFSASFPS